MPTALELGPDGWKPYVEAARRRPPSRRSEADEQARADLMAKARETGAELKSRFGARQVWLFGSLAHGAWFHPDSDVDLAVAGLPPESYWSAWRAAESLFPGRRVELIEYETASESLRQAIDRTGVRL